MLDHKLQVRGPEAAGRKAAVTMTGCIHRSELDGPGDAALRSRRDAQPPGHAQALTSRGCSGRPRRDQDVASCAMGAELVHDTGRAEGDAIRTFMLPSDHTPDLPACRRFFERDLSAARTRGGHACPDPFGLTLERQPLASGDSLRAPAGDHAVQRSGRPRFAQDRINCVRWPVGPYWMPCQAQVNRHDG